MNKDDLLKVLGEFFLDSLSLDAGDVEHWCTELGHSPDDIVETIEQNQGQAACGVAGP